MQLWGHPQKTMGIFPRSKYNIVRSKYNIGGGNYSAGLYSKSWDFPEVGHFHHSMPSLLIMHLGGKGPLVTT